MAREGDQPLADHRPLRYAGFLLTWRDPQLEFHGCPAAIEKSLLVVASRRPHRDLFPGRQLRASVRHDRAVDLAGVAALGTRYWRFGHPGRALLACGSRRGIPRQRHHRRPHSGRVGYRHWQYRRGGDRRASLAARRDERRFR